MKERGMIFNGEMVRALLDGRKTQTRRAVSDRHLHMIDVASQAGECYPLDSGTDHSNSQSYYREWCPFGTVGDRIWARETFATLEPGSYEPVKPQQGYCQELRYAATDRLAKSDSDIRGYKWIPSLHMPRWASRILLEITDVRVERLNSINYRDAVSEGLVQEEYNWHSSEYPLDDIAFRTSWESKRRYSSPQECFKDLWQSIYGEESWQANPWVWVIEFKRIDAADRG